MSARRLGLRCAALPLAALLSCWVARAGEAPAARHARDPGRGSPSERPVRPAPAVLPGAAAPREPAAEVLARFAHEPPIALVQEAAARFAGARPERAASWRSRVRKAGLVPEVRVRVLRGVEDDVLQNASGQTHATSEDLAVEVQARWRFDRLVFDRNELAVSREASHLAGLRHELVAEATRLYFQRRRLQVELALEPPRTTAARAARLLHIDELTAELDGLTGGWFRRTLEEKKP